MFGDSIASTTPIDLLLSTPVLGVLSPTQPNDKRVETRPCDTCRKNKDVANHDRDDDTLVLIPGCDRDAKPKRAKRENGQNTRFEIASN